MTYQKYFITGTSGFIGRNLVENLTYDGCRLLGFDRRQPPRNFHNYQNVNIIVGNLMDKPLLESAIKDVDVCVHLASIMNSRNRAEFKRVNIQGMSNLIETCLEKKVKKFIYISTSDVVVNPDSVYGRTKLRAEELLENSSLDYVILRPTVIYGRYDTKNLGAIINMIKYSPLVPVVGSGEYKRQPLYVGDLIQAIKTCIQVDHRNGRIYNLGGPSAISMNKIIYIILKVLKKKRLVMHVPVRMAKQTCLFFARWNRLLRSHVQQILSIEKDKILNSHRAVDELDFRPIGFETGLIMMLSNDAKKEYSKKTEKNRSFEPNGFEK